MEGGETVSVVGEQAGKAEVGGENLWHVKSYQRIWTNECMEEYKGSKRNNKTFVKGGLEIQTSSSSSNTSSLARYEI